MSGQSAQVRRRAARNALCLLAALLLAGPASAGVTVRSPNGRAVVTIDVPSTGKPLWSVAWRGQAVLDPAPIGLDFLNETAPVLRLRSIARRRHDSMAIGLSGKASRARDRYAEAVLRLTGGARPLELIVRAYDDGVAYRWRFRTVGAFAIRDEEAGFGVPADVHAWLTTADDFTSSYESYYQAGMLADAAPANRLITLPALFRRGPAWAGITEAALHDWAGLYLVRHPGAAGLQSRLSPRLDRPGVAVVGGAGEHGSPWRVVMLGDQPGELIESNLVTLLNPPADGRDWSWVHAGKTSFPWWNDYSWAEQSFKPGLNTATMDAYVDFDADHGIPFHTLDGYDDRAWYGGLITPNGAPQDLTRSAPGIDMAEVLARARRRGVGIRLWCHWIPLRAQLDQTLAQWHSWGVAGLMVDFMNRDDQEMVAFYDEVARKAADQHLTVVFHGAFKPTGENRTWPNVLTREAVRGTEYDKFPDNPGSTPEHEVTTPFTRMLAGPMDVHQGGFDEVAPGAFRNRVTAPQVIGTRARTLATYIVYENALPMVADSPARYAGAIGFDFVAATPVTWDETRVLAGKVGEYIVIARRKGSDWWLGAMTDGHARSVAVPLTMLRAGRWTLDGYADVIVTRAVHREQHIVRSEDQLLLKLASAGGYAAHLSRPKTP